MKLEKLFKTLDVYFKNKEKDLDIKNIVFDSRKVKKGSLFVCLKGANTDGHNYILEAEKKGAVAILTEQKSNNISIPQFVVKNTRKALAIVCSNFYNNPEKSLKLVALVGTNGKTSTTHILKHIFVLAGKNVGVIGSLGFFWGNTNFETDLTTPDPTKLFKIFNFFKQKKVEFVFMEVSAHAIWLEKVYGLEFEIGALTNITQDHLDFFKNMQNYKKTKVDFLKSSQVKTLIVNSDEKSFKDFSNLEVISYGLKNPSDCFALDVVQSLKSTSYALNLFDNVIFVKTKLSGYFNVYNALLASTISLLLGLSTKEIKIGLEIINNIVGRFNIISTFSGEIVLDFAHTPDALENILKAISQISSFKKIILIFGASGNKDSLKRKYMGKIAEKYCDLIILTADDPKYENIELIFEDILFKVKNRQKFIKIEDRKEALSFGIDKLNLESLLVICGKAGEKFQDINGVKVKHDDFQVVFNLLKEKNIQIL